MSEGGRDGWRLMVPVPVTALPVLVSVHVNTARASMHLSIDTVLPADSVEFCPHPDASNIFLCGTYKLQEEGNPQPSDSISTTSGPASQTRTGQCLVFEVDSEQDIRACAARTFVLSISPGLKAVGAGRRSRRYPFLRSWT
jgi:hypothetical protein